MPDHDDQAATPIPLARGEFLTPGAVARMMGVTPKTISNWCERGYLDFVAMPSGHRRIPKAAAERLMNRQTESDR